MPRGRPAEPAPAVAVVGGGVVGSTTALELARRGADVTLFDAGDVASGASGRAAGICYDAFAGRVDAAIADRAMATFRERDAITARPYVWLSRESDDRNADAMAEHVPRMQARGRDVDFVDPDELAGRWPGLRTDDVARAAVARDAGFVDAATYTRETAQFAVAAGADLRTGTRVSIGPEPTVDGDSYDAVVVAAGAHAASLLADAGLPVPVKAYRVQALRTEATPLSNRVPMLYDATGGYYLRPDREGLFVGDGTVPEAHDPDDWDRSADDRFRAACADYLETAVGESVPEHRSWAGLCTATPDGDPLVGERAAGVYVAAGFQGHGFMRAPAIGDRLAAAVIGDIAGGGDATICDDHVETLDELDDPGSLDALNAFDPRRFDGDEDFRIVEGMTLDES